MSQSLEALHQQLDGSARQTLDAEGAGFDQFVRKKCGVPDADTGGAPANLSGATFCVERLYNEQAAFWRSRLTGPAGQEAIRPLELHASLQLLLQKRGLIPATEKIDGIYGPLTRAAIQSWQTAAGRQPTGLLSNADVAALYPEGVATPTSGASKPGLWQLSPPCSSSDPLDIEICGNPDLVRLDTLYLQTYWALYQQSDAAEQVDLAEAAAAWRTSIDSDCWQKRQQLNSVPGSVVECIYGYLEFEEEGLTKQLQTPASEEVKRPIDQNVVLQKALQRMGFLSASENANGILATTTRLAITAWQTARKRSPTGLLDDNDAEALKREGDTANSFLFAQAGTSFADYAHTNTSTVDPSLVSKLMGMSLAAVLAEYPSAECSDDICSFGRGNAPAEACPNLGNCSNMTIHLDHAHVIGYNADFDEQVWNQSLKQTAAKYGPPKIEETKPGALVQMGTTSFIWHVENGLSLMYVSTEGFNMYGAPLNLHTIFLDPKGP